MIFDDRTADNARRNRRGNRSETQTSLIAIAHVALVKGVAASESGNSRIAGVPVVQVLNSVGRPIQNPRVGSISGPRHEVRIRSSTPSRETT